MSAHDFGGPLGGGPEGWLPPDPPRPHHVQFALRALPSAFFERPREAIDILGGPEGRRALEDLWAQTGRWLDSNGRGAALPADGLVGEPVRRPGFHGVLVRLPPAEYAGESEFALLAVPHRVDPATAWAARKAKGAPVARLFLLRLVAWPPEGHLVTTLSEVAPDLRHITTGYRCGPDSASFIREAEELLEHG